MVAELYLREQDWELTRDKVRAENLLQVRTAAAALRISKEVVARLEQLSMLELQCVADGTTRERNHLLWAAACRRYEFTRHLTL